MKSTDTALQQNGANGSDQRWFWTERWQQGEAEVEEHIWRGEVDSFDSMEEFLSSLDDKSA